MSDELPTATRVNDPGIRALYKLENRWQAWLGSLGGYYTKHYSNGSMPFRRHSG
jgi:hypothetical protein